jgi:hypothetical protein
MATRKGNKNPSSPRAKEKNAELVEKAIEAFGKKLDKKNVTVGEFVRLLELQKELDGDEPKEIKVTWVEPGETEPTSEK